MGVLRSLLDSLRRPGGGVEQAPDVTPAKLLSDGIAALAQGRLREAERASEMLLEREPDEPDALYIAGIVAHARGDWDIAAALLERALACGQPKPAYFKDYGIVLCQLGRHREGLQALDRAVGMDPTSLSAHSNRLYMMSACAHLTPQQVWAAHREFGTRVANPLACSSTAFANVRDADRPLRIGYVSADFREHAVSFLFEPVLQRHDRSRFSIHCYYNWPRADDITARMKAQTDGWRDVAGMSDEDLANCIRADGIDILVDLSGHTRAHRLLSFARRPAPVQMTWFGYVQTTGMSAMDWRISDGVMDPPGATEHLNSERLARLPDYFACFRPDPASPDPGSLPAAANGHVTFAVCNNAHKNNDETVALWARILLAVPGSRMRVVVEHGELPDIQRQVFGRFSVHGVSPDRLDVTGRSDLAGFLREVARSDILLDPFPQNGGVTSLHALWMGVPIVTLGGTGAASRNGASLLRAVGLDAWVARDADEYVAIACDRAGNAAALAQLRAGLRQRMRESPLLDEQGFVRNLETVYRQAWREWCHAQ